MLHYRQRRNLPVALARLTAMLVSVLAVGHSAQSSQAILSTYNASVGAPTCLDLGSSCRTDDDMLAGVADFEVHSPNTIDNCTDRSGAVDQQDEYVNRIIVQSQDGGTMVAGQSLVIHVTVTKATNVSTRAKTDAMETLHVYYASESHGESLLLPEIPGPIFAYAH